MSGGMDNGSPRYREPGRIVTHTCMMTSPFVALSEGTRTTPSKPRKTFYQAASSKEIPFISFPRSAFALSWVVRK